ncbi:hypothetical protein [Endozoicomonas sp.]|uniref:hypothetical protein n=1 Tax=Endozoicomonas sp. TaxID=1892382 RepID=UPI00383BF048
MSRTAVADGSYSVGVQGSSASPVQSLSEGDIGVNEQKSDVESGSDDETLSLRPAMSETKDLVNGDVKSSTVGVQGSSASPVQSLSEGDIGVNGQKSDIESGSDDETLSLSSNSSSSAMSETKDPVNGDDKSCTVGDQVPLELQAQSLSDDDNVQKSGVESGSDDDDTRSLIPPMPETKDPVTDSDDRSSVQDQASKESSILLTVMDLPVSSGIDTPQPKASDEVEYPERLSKELPEVGLVDSRIETWKQIEKDNSS